MGGKEMTEISERYERESALLRGGPPEVQPSETGGVSGQFPEFAGPDGGDWRLFKRAPVRSPASPRGAALEVSRSWIEHLHQEHLDMVAKARQNLLDSAA